MNGNSKRTGTSDGQRHCPSESIYIISGGNVLVILRGYIGKSLGELAEETKMSYYPIRVFVIDDVRNDDTGKFLMTGYSLKQIVVAHPRVVNATVVSAKEYVRETIIRVHA